MRSVGLDLGKKEVAFCEVSEGKVKQRRTVRQLHDLRELFGSDAPPAVVAIEACREAWYVHDELTKHGHQVLVVDTTRVKRLGVGDHGRKSDRLDAECFARAVEAGRIPRAHVLSPERRKLREQLNVRRALVETRAQYITTIRGMIRARGEMIGSCDSDDFRRKLAFARLGNETRAAIAPLASLLEALDAQLNLAETELEQLCAKDESIARLTTAPGVNLVVAGAFMSVVDEAKRFGNAHRAESYLGLVPLEDTTGGHRKLGSITKCGNAYVRANLVQAAWSILRGHGDDPLRTWAKQVAKRRGKRIAVVALARRLAGVLWAMCRHGTPYNPMHLAGASARGLEDAASIAKRQADAMKTVERKANIRAEAMRARGKPTTMPLRAWSKSEVPN